MMRALHERGKLVLGLGELTNSRSKLAGASFITLTLNLGYVTLLEQDERDERDHVITW